MADPSSLTLFVVASFQLSAKHSLLCCRRLALRSLTFRTTSSLPPLNIPVRKRADEEGGQISPCCLFERHLGASHSPLDPTLDGRRRMPTGKPWAFGKWRVGRADLGCAF